MNPKQFRAAVEQIIGVPADDDHDYYWQLELSGGREWEGLHIRYAGKGSKDLYFGIDRKSDFDLLMAFDQEHRPCIGENPHTGHWHIFAQDFNYDPEAVLRELARRLAKAGYEGPVSPSEEKPGSDVDHYAALGKVLGLTRDEVKARLTSFPKPGVPVSGCVIGLTEEERGHLAALMETAIEPPENRPPGFVGSVWQGQQDAWASILKKLQP